ncbi:DNA internalization-related competence protein ComEC/Rec2 [Shewanella sp.]|uniref:DNA internalization-related competence protein ComEC/Rec2 n=1 Tax=Shewanella sp. TaxID=50422 RepID=UPI0040543EB1
MNGFIYGFCACLLSSLLWPTLFAPWSWPLLLIMLIILRRKSPFSCGILMGAFWLSYCFYSLFNQLESRVSQPGKFNAKIISLVTQQRDWISFDVKVIDEEFRLFPRIYRLSWRSPPQITAGQVWHFNAKMKGVTSLLNEGGFNQQKYWLSLHIAARGNVREGHLLKQALSVRQQLLGALRPVLLQLNGGDILQALLLGDKTAITPERWQALRRTGAGHLVAISGLHVSVVFGLLLFVTLKFLVWCIPCESRRNWVMAMLASLVGVLGYGYLAGFAIATQRAVIMLLLLVVLSLLRQFSSPWERLLLALFAVLVFDPFAPLSAGFWLSFTALSIILLSLSLGSDRLSDENQGAEEVERETELDSEQETAQVAGQLWHEGWVRAKGSLMQFSVSLWRIQWRLALGLGLLQLLLFGSAALHSIWLNLLFVPWFSFVVIPVTIVSFILWLVCGLVYWLVIAAQSLLFNVFAFQSIDVVANVWGPTQDVSLSVGPRLFYLAELSIAPFLWILDASAQLPWAQVSLASLTVVQGIFCLLGCALVCYVRTWLWRALALSLGLPLLLTLVLTLGSSECCDKAFSTKNWQLHVLDVGQGSAIVVQQGEYGLIYDTGAAYGPSFSYAQRVILPFLTARRIAHLEYLVLSHDDNDHSGGAEVLMAAFPLMTVITDIERFAHKSCQQPPMRWRGLTLELMGAVAEPKDNNTSCVLRLGNDNGRVLLTGDIEALREFKLLQQGAPLSAEVILVPHHGSNTSSSEAFLQAVGANIGIFSAGFANQYGFPKARVLNRYHKLGIDTYITGELGQISLSFRRDGIDIRGYRTQLAPFWYNQVFRFGSSQKPE